MTDAARTRTRQRARPAKADTDTTTRTGGVDTTSHQHADHKPVKDAQIREVNNRLVAYVTVRDGVTLNMTDYNSFRRDIGVELPFNLDPSLELDDLVDETGSLTAQAAGMLDKVYDALQDWVSDKHAETVQDATDYFGD